MSENGSLGFVVEPEKQVPISYDVDVAVAGAGIAGLFAALAAARYGVRTVLIDRFGSLGGNIGPGMIVLGGICNEAEGTLPGGLAGIPREFMAKLEELRGTPGPNYVDESSIVSYLGCKLAKEAGMELLLSVWAADPIIEGDQVRGLFVEGKSGRVAVKAKVVVDATGEADIALRAKVPVISALPADPSYAPLMGSGKKEYSTWNDGGIHYVVGHVDVGEYERFALDCIPLSEEDRAWLQQHNVRLSPPQPLVPALRRVWESGEFRCAKDIEQNVHMGSSFGVRNYGSGLWGSHIYVRGEIHRNDMKQHSRLEAALRSHAFETVRFLRNNAPGFEKAYLLFTAPYFGARGGPFIDGEHTLTPEEAFTGRKFDDVLFRNIHEGQLQHGGDKSGFDVSYRMILPKGLDGLLVTGRGAAYLRRGHDPTGMRARPSMMVLGQATGTAAALAAREGITPKKLDVRKLQRELLKQGFFLGDENRLEELGLK